MLRNNEVQSLQLLSQSASQKLQLEAQYYAASLALVRNALQQLSSGTSGGAAANVRAGVGSVSLTQNITGGTNADAIATAAANATQKTLESFFSW